MPITTSSPVAPSLSTSSPIKLTFITSSSYPQTSPKPHPSRLLLHNHTLTPAVSRLLFVPCNSIPRCSTTPLDAGPVPENHSPVSSARCSPGLVLDLGKGNSWDSAEVGSPVVKRFLNDQGERWYMWYHGRSHGGADSSPDCIGLAVSNDGIHWERGQGAVSSGIDAGMVMSRGSDWWCFDTTSIRPGDVMVMSSSMVRGSGGGVYWMYYTGYSSETLNLEGAELSSRKLEGLFKSLPGLAMSQDGRHWARIEGEHHSGALFDVGSENEWESLFIASPRVVFHGKGDLRMYYHSFDAEAGEFCVGMARSRDGMRWAKLGKVMMDGGKTTTREGRFDEKGAVNAHVMRNKEDGRYVMAYEGVGGEGRRSIGMAVSEDGLKGWTRVGDGDRGTLEGSGGDGWDGEGVVSPYLVQMDGGEWRLYYGGLSHGGRSNGIGLCCFSSQVGDFTSFRPPPPPRFHLLLFLLFLYVE